MTPFLKLLPLILAITIPTFATQTPKTLVAPITQSGNLFTITLDQNNNLVVDIESPLSWLHCRRSFPRVSCRTRQCSEAQSDLSPSCILKIPEIPLEPFGPVCPCFTLPYNPITDSCASSLLTRTMLGYMDVFVSCAPRSLRQTLPKDCSGIASLSKGSLSLVTQFSIRKVCKKFGLCLADHGVAFFGDAPLHILPPSLKETEMSQLLSFTSLLRHPRDNAGYYIGVEGILVNSEPVKLPNKMFLPDRNGNGGVKLSTITRYTAIRSDIYWPFLRQFERASSGIPRAPSVAPFDICFNWTNLTTAGVGLRVPQIDLQLSGGVKWTISGANSMVHVSRYVACLAFVDQGKKAEQVMVIGSYQMMNNLLVFDLDLMRVGFSPSLMLNTSCNHSNFSWYKSTIVL